MAVKHWLGFLTLEAGPISSAFDNIIDWIYRKYFCTKHVTIFYRLFQSTLKFTAWLLEKSRLCYGDSETKTQTNNQISEQKGVH